MMHGRVGTVFRRNMLCRHFSHRVAIVGSGPSSLYTAKYLMDVQNLQVDIIEKLPVPYGLVR
jgi:ribulose 1,5-bisphosphate synthetase/thiazole synthase